MSDRPALVLLHGFTNSGASWSLVVSKLAKRYRPIIAPDIRGHASASERQPVSLEAVLGDIAALSAPTFTLVGYSQGGRLALHAALAMPERVTGLVLIGASPGIADPDQRVARRLADERLAGELEAMTIEEFSDRWAQTLVLAGVGPAVAEMARLDRLRSTPDGLARALRGLGTGALPSLWDRLAELQMPVVLAAGERDRKFVEIAEQMAGRIPHARSLIVPGSGHAVHLERPGAIINLLRTFPGS